MFELPPDPVHGPQGAIRQADGSVVWRTWAPRAERVDLITWLDGERRETPMSPEGEGYFVHRASAVAEGLRYAYRLDGGAELPDPASRWQPDGVHRPSAVFFPEHFAWTDADWQGVPRAELVIYELHVGTFTREGTFEAVIPRLAPLAELGITAIELMPVAQFPGARNWGYDGVHLYAAQNSYGGPRGLQRLVEAAHRAGLAVILDVVYNHFGPEGNYLGRFGPYFSDRHRTPWGDAVNFDGPDSDAVRQFVVENACMWVRDFHMDGLRLDAVHAIYDLGARHILAEIQDAVQQVATAGRQGRNDAARGARRDTGMRPLSASLLSASPLLPKEGGGKVQAPIVHVIAESSSNDVRLVQPPERGGYGLDGVWTDDFHHSVHALLTGERDGYYMDFGSPAHLAKAFNDAFVYDGRYSAFRRRRHGSRAGALDRSLFVVSIQTHDQVGNRALGERLSELVPPAAQRLAAALMLLSPFTPMLFMGEEYAETRRFPWFCSFEDRALVEAVRRGRREEFAALRFQWGTEIPDPQDPATFESAKLAWDWPEGSAAAGMRRLYADLLAARRRWPALVDRQHTSARLVTPSGWEHGEPGLPLLVLQRGRDSRLVACANSTGERHAVPFLDSAERRLLLSTEWTRYGGERNADAEAGELLPYEMLVFGAGEVTVQ